MDLVSAPVDAADEDEGGKGTVVSTDLMSKLLQFTRKKPTRLAVGTSEAPDPSRRVRSGAVFTCPYLPRCWRGRSGCSPVPLSG